MNITKCDICGKTINDRQEVCIGYLSPLPSHSLCLKCGKPVVDLLKKNKLIETGKKKSKLTAPFLPDRGGLNFPG